MKSIYAIHLSEHWFSFSSKLGHEQTAKLLIQNGADINTVNKIGDTALLSSIGSGNLETKMSITWDI